MVFAVARADGGSILPSMRIAQGTVVAGKIELEGGPLPEGALVTVIVREGEESFTLTPEQDAELLAAMAEPEDQLIDADEILRELRS